MRDKAQKFYNFENGVVKKYLPSSVGDGLSLEESRELVNQICSSYRVNPPLVKEGRSARRAYYAPSKHQIVLPPWAQRTYLVIHETAHAIARSRDMAETSHGPTFIRTWMELFSRMYDIPIEKLQEDAEREGLLARSFLPV